MSVCCLAICVSYPVCPCPELPWLRHWVGSSCLCTTHRGSLGVQKCAFSRNML